MKPSFWPNMPHEVGTEKFHLNGIKVPPTIKALVNKLVQKTSKYLPAWRRYDVVKNAPSQNPTSKIVYIINEYTTGVSLNYNYWYWTYKHSAYFDAKWNYLGSSGGFIQSALEKEFDKK